MLILAAIQPRTDTLSTVTILLLITLSFLQIALLIGCLFDLRKSSIHDVAKVLWAFMILTVPLLGPITFMIVNPNSKTLQALVSS